MKHLSLIALALAFSTSSLAAGKGLSKGQVRELVRPVESQVASCAQNGGVGGTLKVHFTVKPDGSVADFTASAPHKSDAAAKCAEDALAGIKFPESVKGTHSKWRFQLGAKPKASPGDAASGDKPAKKGKGKAKAAKDTTVPAEGTK